MAALKEEKANNMPRRSGDSRQGSSRRGDAKRGDARGKRDRENEFSERKTRVTEKITEIDFRDLNLLRKFVTPHGKIMPSRLTGISAKQQRKIAQAIQRARVMGLMP